MAQKRKDWNGLISGFKASDLVFLDESGCNTDMTRRSPGCGSQLPPLAAVVAVASGLTGTTMTVSPTKRKAPLEVATPRGFSLFGVTILTLDIPDFRIPDPPQKSSFAQKVYKRPLRHLRCHLSQRERLWQAG